MGTIRLILAISVVIAHSTPLFGVKLVGGQIAVQAFYIISGFYMSLILNEKYVNKGSYKLFISNRFYRLFPIYWAVLLCTIAFSFVVAKFTDGNSYWVLDSYRTHNDQMGTGSLAFLILTNLTVFFQDFVMFLGLDTDTGSLFFTENFQNTDPQLRNFLLIPQAWTVGLELMFYVIAPFIVRRKLAVVSSIIAASIALRIILYSNGLTNDPWTYRFFPTELALFLFGYLAYRFYTYLREHEFKKEWGWISFGVVLLITFIYQYIAWEPKQYIYLILFMMALPFIFMLTKKWKWDTKIGEFSYPIYISHIFVLGVIYYLELPIISSLGVTLLICSVVFSIGLNFVIGRPIEKLRQRRVERSKAKL